MPKVYNKYHGDAPADAVYIGRGSPWGNPFSHQGVENTIPVATRDEAVDAFERKLMGNEKAKERVRKELRGRDVVCYCAPKRCHGDILVRIANEDEHGLPVPSKTPPMPEVHRVKPLNQKTLEALAEVVTITGDNIEFLDGSLLSNNMSSLIRQALTTKRERLQRGKEYLESLLAKKTHHTPE